MGGREGELGLDVALHGGSGRGCEGEAWDRGEGGPGLPQLAVGGTEIVPPLRKESEGGREVWEGKRIENWHEERNTRLSNSAV